MYISRRDRDANPYAALQERSVAMLQQLCGEVWTDYNAHDPGVTMLDILNHALEELRYKFSFPLGDYLVERDTGRIPFERMGLLPFEELLRGSVVTAQDYERLMEDTIPEIEACRAVFSRGCYDFTLYGASVGQETMRKAAMLYHANRNLCETLGEIHISQTPPPEIMCRDNDVPRRKPSAQKPTHRDIAAYRSVQLDFPDCYGINSRGVPPHALREDEARILQLRAYMLIFDHLLAAAGEQASQIGSTLLLSPEIESRKWPKIKDVDAEQLIDTERQNNLPHDFLLSQRKAWFATLDMLYGEDTSHLSLEERTEMIPLLPEINRRRFCTTDILGNWENENDPFHVVEHILLYPDHNAPEKEACRMTIVYPLAGCKPPKIEERMPAHISLDIRGILPNRWVWFERFWFDWRIALAEGGRERIREASIRMKNIMQ